MRKFNRYLLLAAGVGIVSLTLAFTNVGHVLAQQINAYLVRDVDNPARSAFRAFTEVSLSGNVSGTSQVIATVPDGKRLVIEFVSVRAVAATGLNVEAGVEVFEVHQGGIRGHLYGLTLSPQGTFSGRDDFVASQPTRLYADGGTDVQVILLRNSAAVDTSAGADYEMSGYLVDCGAGSGCPIP